MIFYFKFLWANFEGNTCMKGWHFYDGPWVAISSATTLYDVNTHLLWTDKTATGRTCI